MNLSGYKHFIWDWNGTLFDDARLCVDIMSGLLQRRGLPGLTLSRYQEVFGFPVRDYYERLGFDFNAEAFEVLGTEFIEEYDRRRFECRLQPGAREALEAVAHAGITQSILSAYHRESLEEMAEHFEVRHYFLKLIGLTDHYAHGKIRLGREWIDKLHYAADEVLLVGDTVHDHEVATEMNTDCVLIPSGHHTGEKLARCSVPVIESLSSFGNLLAGI